MVTYADIAQKMGISKAAVSLALRHQKGVSEDLRKRVVSTAESMGYKPNPLVSAHMAHLRGTKAVKYKGKIAFLSAEINQAETEKHYRDSLYWNGAKKAAEKLGFDIEVFSMTDPKVPRACLGRILQARGIPGIIIGPTPSITTQLGFDISPFSAVTLGYTLRSPNLHRIRPNAYDMALILFDILTRQRGYKRPGLVQTAMEDAWVLHLWTAGFHIWKTTQKKTAKIPPMLILETQDRDRFFKWFEKYNPDVIIGHPFAAEWLKEKKLRIPEDVGVATLFSRQPFAKFSGLHPDLFAAGEAAVHLVSEQIYNSETGEPKSPRLILIPPKWNEGSTLRPPLPDVELGVPTIMLNEEPYDA